jgi:hypothetical protein
LKCKEFAELIAALFCLVFRLLTAICQVFGFSVKPCSQYRATERDIAVFGLIGLIITVRFGKFPRQPHSKYTLSASAVQSA